MNNGYSATKISRELNISRSTVYKVIKEPADI
ncbi:helix-turn-helix domain-containing protein [Klebsiella electrica]